MRSKAKILVITIFGLLTVAMNAHAATPTHLVNQSYFSIKQVDILHLTKGKLTPKFQNAAKAKRPLATAKSPTRPKAIPRSVAGRPLSGTKLSARVRAAKLPSARQLSTLVRKPVVSTAAARRLNTTAVKPTAKTLASKQLLPTRKSSAINKLRLLPKPQHTPYAGGRIRSFVTKKDETYYRVYSNGKNTGSFLTKTPPKSQTHARSTLALPPGNKATHIQKVLVPAGTRMIRSRALPAFGKRGGGEQFLLMNKIPRDNFGIGKQFK